MFLVGDSDSADNESCDSPPEGTSPQFVYSDKLAGRRLALNLPRRFPSQPAVNVSEKFRNFDKPTSEQYFLCKVDQKSREPIFRAVPIFFAGGAQKRNRVSMGHLPEHQLF
jgi:hypothetical protein